MAHPHLQTRQQLHDEALRVLEAASGQPIPEAQGRIATAQVLATLATAAPETTSTTEMRSTT